MVHIFNGLFNYIAYFDPNGPSSVILMQNNENNKYNRCLSDKKHEQILEYKTHISELQLDRQLTS
jgi:hypothetical protein